MRLAVFALVALSLSAQINFYSREKEEALGAQLAAEVTKNTTPLESAAARAYVHRLGRQLAAVLPDQPFHFTFLLVTDDLGGSTHEPEAIPAGYIFVPASLLLAAHNDAEVAGMLAHAMIHVTARHATREATRTELMQIGSYSVNRDSSQIPLAALSMKRAFERQADNLAVQTEYAAGYDPAAFAAYVARTQTDQGASISAVFASLPAREERIAALDNAIHILTPKTYTAPTDELATIQAEIRKLIR